MAMEQDMSGWTDLLHSSTKLLEQAAPSAQFPPLERNLDQLEALSKKLKAKTLRAETPTQFIAATRLLAREGINAEQLARDLKSFELKTTFEDVFPAEATSVEEYLQQVHEMTMVSAIQEAQKDNVRSFDDYMLKVFEEDWQKEKRGYLQSLSRISALPRTNMITTSTGSTHAGQAMSLTSSPQVFSGASSGMDIIPLGNKPILEQKAAIYAEVVRNLNNAREHGLPYKPATAFKSACESFGPPVSGGKSVNMQKIWHLIQSMMGEESTVQRSISKRMSLAIGARCHLEWGHEKYITDTIQSHPAQAALGGAVGNMQRIHAFLRIRLRDYGVLDFDGGDARRHPPVDTTWQQVYFCLRTGYYEEARNVAMSSRSSHQFAPLLTEWINTGGMVPIEIAAAASDECEKMLRIVGDRVSRSAYDKKKLLLYAIISGSRKHIDRLLRDYPSLFTTIEDFLWFKLSAVRDCPIGAQSSILSESLVPYTLEDLQNYLNKFDASYYTKNGKDPLVYPYVLLLSIQLLPAVLYLSKEESEGYNIDASHISIVLADNGVLSEGVGAGQKMGMMDAYAEVSRIIRHYGSLFLRLGNLSLALEYYAQAAAAVGGGQLSWSGRGNVDQQRQRNLMLKQLLTEVVLVDGGIHLLLGSRGAGEEGELSRFLSDLKTRQQFLLEAAHQCQESGLYDKSIEIQKRVGAFSMALDTINNCLAEAICALARGRLDGESRTAGLIHSGNEILETYKYYPVVNPQERENVSDQQTVLRQLEAILSIHKLARVGHYIDALREVAKLSFLPLDPRTPDIVTDVFQNLSPHVQVCIPDLLKVALTCIESVTDSDGSLRALRAKIASFIANNSSRNWPRDLYEKVARNL